MTTATRPNFDGPPRQTLANQLDRLDRILDGLSEALAGAVQEAVEQAVKQAVQAVLTEVLTNRHLQEQLQQATQPTPPSEEPRAKKGTPNRLWQATTEAVRRMVQAVKKVVRGVGMYLVAAGCVVVGAVYAAHKRIACAAYAVYSGGKRLLHGGHGPDEHAALVHFRQLMGRVEAQGGPGRSISLALRQLLCRKSQPV
jgi:hypothetical protein